MNKRRFFAIAFAGALIGCHAQAALMTDSASFGLSNLNNYDSSYFVPDTGYDYFTQDADTTFQYLTLDRFDPLLGTLTGVSIGFTSNFWHYSYGFARDYSTFDSYSGNSSSGFTTYEDASIGGSAYANFTLALTDTFYTSESADDYNTVYCEDSVSEAWAGPGSQANAECNAIDQDPMNAFNGFLDLSSFSLADFVGLDDLNLILRNDAYVYAYCDTDLYAYCAVQNDTYWYGDVTVEYTYEVSEPGTLAILGLGLVGLGWARRRAAQ